MTIYEGEVNPEKLTTFRKEGFNFPIFKCQRKMSCKAFTGHKGRVRCPGKLIETGDNLGTIPRFCGWSNNTNGMLNAVKIYTTDYEKYIPPESVIPII